MTIDADSAWDLIDNLVTVSVTSAGVTTSNIDAQKIQSGEILNFGDTMSDFRDGGYVLRASQCPAAGIRINDTITHGSSVYMVSDARLVSLQSRWVCRVIKQR